ncbi:MAG: LytTR family DNA-binding domain-containing protein [Emticicia sp.]|nr:LytTR family DNA-binding domain-containing protein [Emticicia sp.]
MLKAIIVDDEYLAIKRLERIIAEFDDEITIVGTASDGQEGLALTEELKPNVVFLDIEMPVMNGFEMLAQLSYSPLIVFTTAFDHYAIQAFESNSIDYLLKPIESERLSKTIKKIAKTQAETLTFEYEKIFSFMQEIKPQKHNRAISIKSGEKILLIPFSEIIYFEAQERYVFVSTIDGKQYITNYTIAGLEEKLPETFVRISRSSIINSDYIQELQKYFSGKYMVLMKDKKTTKIETGLNYHDNLKRIIHF